MAWNVKDVNCSGTFQLVDFKIQTKACALSKLSLTPPLSWLLFSTMFQLNGSISSFSLSAVLWDCAHLDHHQFLLFRPLLLQAILYLNCRHDFSLYLKMF